MGAYTCNVNMDDAPTKKSFHKIWEDISKMPGGEAWWGMNGYTLHESFTNVAPLKQKDWNVIERESNDKSDAKWNACLVGLVWKTKTRNPALKKFIKWLETLEELTPPIVSKEEFDEYKEWQRVGGKWKPYFFMNDDKKSIEIMTKYSALETYFANYKTNNTKYQKHLKKKPECPVWAVIASVVPC